MNVRRRLTFRFVFHFVLLLFVIIIFLTSILFHLAFKISSVEMDHNFTKVDEGYLKYNIEMDGEKAVVDEKIHEAVLSKNGWLQIIDEQGKVISSVNTPAEIPASYRFVELIDVHFEEYKTYHWSVELEHGNRVAVLYGERFRSQKILHTLKEKESFPLMTEEMNQYLQQQNAWVQIYDDNGQKIQDVGSTENKTYTFNDILSIEKEPWNHKEELSTYYVDDQKLLYVVGTNNLAYSPDYIADDELWSSLSSRMLVTIGLLILLVTILSFWYGKKFGIPILHVMRWINNMSEGEVEEPRNKKGKRPLLNKKGVLHKRYRVFKDVIASLESLGDTLKRNEEEQTKIEKTREEWITGLSHDLKTPLTSIYGYAALLETEDYTWSKEETMEFGRVMREKSAYMSELIDDLTLTYQLKNNGLPLQTEKREIVSLVRELVKAYCTEENEVQIQCNKESIFLDIDMKWFTRMMNNLLANARKHNPSDTEVTVVVEQNSTSTAILVKDNGVGMDEETIGKLFNRYYRGGTTTDNSDGSGLGMAIAHQLVVAHGGKIQVMSQRGFGTVIKLIFPRKSFHSLDK